MCHSLRIDYENFANLEPEFKVARYLPKVTDESRRVLRTCAWTLKYLVLELRSSVPATVRFRHQDPGSIHIFARHETNTSFVIIRCIL